MERKSHALLVFHRPLARRCRVEFIGPGPYLRVDQAEHRLGLAVDGDHRMDEKSSRYALACWPKTSVTLRATGLLDLVMSCGATNPTSLTGSWWVLRKRPNYLATRDRWAERHRWIAITRAKGATELRITSEPVSTNRPHEPPSRCSTPARAAGVHMRRCAVRSTGSIVPVMIHPIIQRVEIYQCLLGQLVAERLNRAHLRIRDRPVPSRSLVQTIP